MTEYKKSEPMVSICCIAYNHEKYIGQTLDGFLMQKTNFPLEVIVHDDASTDGTAEIIRKYHKKYPEIIRPVFQRENQYSKGIKISATYVWPLAKGKYIAICEGDDYWVDPLKLQKQVDFLETHEDYVICFHDAMIVDENDTLIQSSKLPDALKRDFSSEELIQGKWILTLTMCFRNVLKDFPDELAQVYNGDKFLTSLLGNFGKGKYMADIAPAVYRKHSGAIWSSMDEINQIVQNGNTRAWLHRYYKRIGKDKYAEYFKEEVINHFTRVLTKIESTGGKQHEDIINKIFSQYSDIIDSISENKLRELVRDNNHFENANPIVKESYGSSPSNFSHHLSEVRTSDSVSLDFWLEKKSWLYKKRLYADCFESVTFSRHVDSPAISIIVISWRLHPDNLKNFQILEKQRHQNFELIFVDNGGKEGEFETLRPYVDTIVRLNKNTGAYLARNVGAVFAKAPVLLFLEDDGIPEHNFVEAHLSIHRKFDVIAVRGVYRPKTDTPINEIAKHYYMGDMPYPYPSNLEGNSSYRADSFYKIGGWNDEILFGYGGWDMAVRFLEMEPDLRKQIYSPDPVIYHDFATNAEHLSSKLKKQEGSLNRLMSKNPQWYSIINSWNIFAGRHDVLIKYHLMKRVWRWIRDWYPYKKTI